MIIDGRECTRALPAVKFSKKKEFALQCFTLPFIRYVAIDLIVFAIIQMLLFVFFFCSLNVRVVQVSGRSYG